MLSYAPTWTRNIFKVLIQTVIISQSWKDRTLTDLTALKTVVASPHSRNSSSRGSAHEAKPVSMEMLSDASVLTLNRGLIDGM